MNGSLSTRCALLGSLLEYPSHNPDTTAAHITDLLEADAPGSGTAMDADLALLAKRLQGASLDGLRREYVLAFDFTPARSLFMAWHVYGDTPRQGRALAALSELYADAGFTLTGGVLPDYLPAMLEFLSVAPEWAVEAICQGFMVKIRELGLRLGEAQNVYAHAGTALVSLANALLPAPQAHDAVEGYAQLRVSVND